jgi:hypothetical protein
MALWGEHRFRIDMVARQAGVHEDTIFAMLGWHPVEREDAAKVLAELSRLYQREYTFQTVWVKLREERDENAKVEVASAR